MSPADDRLDAAELEGACAGQLIGRRIVVREEVSSTNDVVAQLAPDADEGLVAIAERQTAGRGQYGRRWESAAGKGLWLSALLRPTIGVAESGQLTTMLAETIAAAIARELGLSPRIKPPNDVYIDERKVAGVLVEMRVEANGGYCAIAGIGINVNHAPGDFPPELRESAGSLATAAGRPVSRAAFARTFLQELDSAYARMRAAN